MKSDFAIITIGALLIFGFVAIIIIGFGTFISEFTKPQTSSSGMTCTQSRIGYSCLYK